MLRNGRICSIEYINGLLDHGLLLGLAGQGVGGGADDHGLGTKDSPTWTGATLSGLTLGSVLFAGTSGVVSQDNSNLFWNNTLKRLGLFTNTPSQSFVVQDGAGVAMLFGADTGAKTLTDNTWKFVRFGMPHYDIEEEPSALFIGSSDSALSYLVLGGGTSIMKAMMEIRFNTAVNNTTDTGTERMRINSLGNVSIGGGVSAETLLEMTGAAPYLTLHNSTHEDSDGGGESRIIGKREDGAGTETAAGQIEISHDGAGANDQLGKIVQSVNTGAGLVDATKIDSTGVFQTIFGRKISRTSVTSSPYNVLAADEHISTTTATVAITLNLPAIIDGAIYHFKDQDGNSAGKNITLSPNGAETIENAANLVINVNGASVTLVGNSTTSNWEIQ